MGNKGSWGATRFAGALCLGLLFAGPALAQQEQECLLESSNPQRPPTIVKFDVDSTAINGEDRRQLIEFAERMRGNPSSIICVIGQADKQGDDAYNYDLARRRAQEVGNLLTNNGVNPSRMIVAVRGEAFDDNLFGFFSPFDTDRRVEVLRWDKVQAR